MHRAYAVLPQGPKVRRRWIALVLIEAVLWVNCMQLKHSGITKCLGQNGRRGNGGHLAITADNRLRRTRQLRAAVAVDQRVAWRYSQRLDRTSSMVACRMLS